MSYGLLTAAHLRAYGAGQSKSWRVCAGYWHENARSGKPWRQDPKSRAEFDGSDVSWTRLGSRSLSAACHVFSSRTPSPSSRKHSCSKHLRFVLDGSIPGVPFAVADLPSKVTGHEVFRPAPIRTIDRIGFGPQYPFGMFLQAVQAQSQTKQMVCGVVLSSRDHEVHPQSADGPAHPVLFCIPSNRVHQHRTLSSHHPFSLPCRPTHPLSFRPSRTSSSRRGRSPTVCRNEPSIMIMG